MSNLSPELKSWVSNSQGEHVILAQIMGNETFKHALTLAESILDKPTYYGTESTLELNALQHAEAQGQKKIIQTLKLLSKPPQWMVEEATEKKVLPPPFEYLKSEKRPNTIA
ncbi:MAG: hypothetical protein WCL08_00150 [Verrucomicrobiota bacterium]